MKPEPTDIAVRETTALQRHEPGQLPPEMTQIINKALDKGVPVEAMEKLVGLAERVSDRAAAQEFAAALAQFQQECPPIRQTRTAKITTSGGAAFSFTYAPLEEIADTIRAPLHSQGFSYTWDTEVKDNMLTATCFLRHINGHVGTSKSTVPTTTRAGMSEQQKIGSAAKYAKRQSLIDVLGLTTCDADTPDTPAPEMMEPITASQVADIAALIDEVKADKAKFLRWLKVERLADITADQYDRAVKELRRKGAKG